MAAAGASAFGLWLATRKPSRRFPYGLYKAESLAALVASFIVSRAERRVAERINSASLLANARENLFDVISAAVVLIGISLDYLRIPYAEGAAIVLIAFLILRLAAQTIWGSLLSLLDANTDPDLTRRVKAILDSIYGIKGTSEVRIRQAGPVLMVDDKPGPPPGSPQA